MPTSPSAAAAATPAAPETRHVDYRAWAGGPQLSRGTLEGVAVRRGRLRLADPGASGATRTRRISGTSYEHGRWTSPWHQPGFGLTQAVASWSARTPGGSLIEVHLQVRDDSAGESGWHLMGRWAAGDAHVLRASHPGLDDLGRVDVDTWKAHQAAGVAAYRLRVTLLRPVGQASSPRVDSVGVMSSRLPSGTPATSRPGDARGVVLDVPCYSQMTHRGHYPQWGGGGEAWCSPTSTAMVLAYYDALPGPRAHSWVPAGHADPWIDAAARHTYDHAFQGTGNWPFSTAWAATRTGRAFVTRLTSARRAEELVAAGIPLVASISFATGELDGAPIPCTRGHLLVVVGFDMHGDVVVNDPAASSSSAVRRTYDRSQFERAWLGGSGGLVYVVHDRDHPLPAPGPHPAW